MREEIEQIDSCGIQHPMSISLWMKKHPAMTLFAVMAASAAFSFIFHVLMKLPGLAMSPMGIFVAKPQIWVPVVSVFTLAWLPWTISRLHPKICREHFAGFAFLFAFIGWDLIHRLSHTWYFPNWWPNC